MKHWYLAKSKPQQEIWLMVSLISLGLDVYFPKITRIRRGKHYPEPLFPTYMFCHLDDDFLERPTIRWAPGLSYFLGNNGTPVNLPNSLIDYFQVSVESWNNRILDGTIPYREFVAESFTQPFKTLDTIFKNYMDSRKRCKLLLQTLGNPSALNLERDYLRWAIDVL